MNSNISRRLNLQDIFEFQCAMTRGLSSGFVTVTLCADCNLTPECAHTLIEVL